jgi:hypothetical protein
MGRYDVVRTQLLGQDVVKVGRRAPSPNTFSLPPSLSPPPSLSLSPSLPLSLPLPLPLPLPLLCPRLPATTYLAPRARPNLALNLAPESRRLCGSQADACASVTYYRGIDEELAQQDPSLSGEIVVQC